MSTTELNPLDEAREAALLLLSRLILFLWLPLFLAALIVRWDRVLAQPLVWVIFAIVPLSGIVLRPSPSRPAKWRAGVAVVLITVACALGMLTNGPRASNATAVAIVFTLIVLFFGRRELVVAAVLLFATGWAGLEMSQAPAVLPSTVDADLPIYVRAATLIITITGLGFTAAVLGSTLRIYRDSQAALEQRQQAMLDAQRESEALQRRELVGSLATGMAHDLANIVQVMTHSADLLEDHDLDSDSRTAVREIRAVGARVSQVLRTLLSLGRSDTQTGNVALAQFLPRVELLLRPLMGRRVTLELVNDATRVVSVDAGRIEQVILNLALNARDAMPDGGTLRLHVMDAPSTVNGTDGVLIVISDTGTGITPEVQARMFDPFFSTKAPGRGTGMGLALVTRIVSDAGGRIDVQSAVGQGTTFRIWLPTDAVRVAA
jgi:signal transduction histidine kinase